MNFTCNECNDTGSRDKLGTYLDCNACGTASMRRDLNDFVKSLGPTHPEDVALAIHQRALAMVPKQEAQDISSLPKWHHFIDEPSRRDDDCGEWCLVADAISHGIILAVPAAANGALTDERAAFDKWSKPIPYVLFSDYAWQAWQARAILAAAGPDAALVALIHKAQSILAHHLPPDGPDAKTTISALLGLLDGPESRAALSGAKGN